jgi:2-polyprenyl-3-methyl-5-hydroxy-6-metoxy-1,4-benzoquinol methylase
MSTQDYGWSEAAPHSCGYIAPKIKTLVDRHTPRSVLDLGCGNGELLKILATPGRTVVGVEYDRGGSEIAQRNNPGARVFNLGVQDDPAPVLASQPDKFDVVVSTEVIEHLYSPALLPRFAARVLKRGGYSSSARPITAISRIWRYRWRTSGTTITRSSGMAVTSSSGAAAPCRSCCVGRASRCVNSMASADCRICGKA